MDFRSHAFKTNPTYTATFWSLHSAGATPSGSLRNHASPQSLRGSIAYLAPCSRINKADRLPNHHSPCRPFMGNTSQMGASYLYYGT